jgi:hypothetical protein
MFVCSACSFYFVVICESGFIFTDKLNLNYISLHLPEIKHLLYLVLQTYIDLTFVQPKRFKDGGAGGGKGTTNITTNANTDGASEWNEIVLSSSTRSSSIAVRNPSR